MQHRNHHMHHYFNSIICELHEIKTILLKSLLQKTPPTSFWLCVQKGSHSTMQKLTQQEKHLASTIFFLFDLIWLNIERFFFFFQHKKRGIYFFPNFRGIKGERSYSLAGATPRTRVWVVVLLSSAKSGYILHLQLIKSNQIKISLSQFLV